MTALPPHLQRVWEALEVVRMGYCILRREQDMELPSVANGSRGQSRGATFKAAESVKEKRKAARFMCVGLVHLRQPPGEWEFVIVLTRIAPRSLDSDNLERALKACRDGVADALGVDDGDERVTWLCNQERGAPKQQALRVEVYRR